MALVGKLRHCSPSFALLAVTRTDPHAGFELPYRGDIGLIVIAAALFILAYQSLAVLLQLFVLICRSV